MTRRGYPTKHCYLDTILGAVLVRKWASLLAKVLGAAVWFDALVNVAMNNRTGTVALYLVHKWDCVVFHSVCLCVC